jgi:hypothetical protein
VTTVVGVAVEAGVWMAADSRTNVYDRPVFGAMKILELPVEGTPGVLIGVAGNAGMPGVIRRVWPDDVAAPGSADVLQNWCDEIASILTTPMVDAGMTDEGQLDGNFLLGIPGRLAVDLPSSLWTVGHHMAIRLPDGRGAVGAGEGPAMGALDALLDGGAAPDMAVLRACEIAITRCLHSDGPVNAVCLESV